MSYTCLTAWVVVFLLVPLIILVRFCESEGESIFWLRHEGNSYRSIADRLGVSVYRVRKELVTE